MPSIVRSSSRVLRYVREPHDDEQYVMKRYADHARHCLDCTYPCASGDRTTSSICSRGHRHARKLVRYIYNNRGKAYSVADRDDGNPTRIAIPPEYDVINDLMRAMDRGLEIQPSRPPTPPKPLVHEKTFDSSLPLPLPPRPDSPPVSESVLSSEHERPRKKRSRDSDPTRRSPLSNEGAFHKHKKANRDMQVQYRDITPYQDIATYKDITPYHDITSYRDITPVETESKRSPRLRTPESWLS